MTFRAKTYICLFVFVVIIAMHRAFQFSGALKRSSIFNLKTRNHVGIKCFSTVDTAKVSKKGGKGQGVAGETAKSPVQGIEELKKVRIAKMDAFKAKGVNPFAYTFEQTHKAAQLQTTYADLANGTEREDVEVSVSGRIMLRRVFGKLAFFQLQDDTGSIQLYLEKGKLPDESFEDIKSLTDAGDIIGVKGTLKRTDKVSSCKETLTGVRVLAKLCFSCSYLPSKFSGRAVDIRHGVEHPHQVAFAPARQVPWPDRREQAVSPAPPGHDCAPGGEKRVPLPCLHQLRHPAPPRHGRFRGDRNTHLERPARWGGSEALRDPSQLAGHAADPPDRHGAPLEAPRRGRLRPRVRDWAHLPQRGAVHATQP